MSQTSSANAAGAVAGGTLAANVDANPFEQALREAHDHLLTAHVAAVTTLEAELQRMRVENTMLRIRLGNAGHGTDHAADVSLVPPAVTAMPGGGSLRKEVLGEAVSPAGHVVIQPAIAVANSLPEGPRIVPQRSHFSPVRTLPSSPTMTVAAPSSAVSGAATAPSDLETGAAECGPQRAQLTATSPVTPAEQQRGAIAEADEIEEISTQAVAESVVIAAADGGMRLDAKYRGHVELQPQPSRGAAHSAQLPCPKKIQQQLYQQHHVQQQQQRTYQPAAVPSLRHPSPMQPLRQTRRVLPPCSDRSVPTIHFDEGPSSSTDGGYGGPPLQEELPTWRRDGLPAFNNAFPSSFDALNGSSHYYSQFRVNVPQYEPSPDRDLHG